MNYKELLTIRGKQILIVYTKMYETVAKMVLKYYDKEQFYNTLFVINTLVDENDNDVDYKAKCPGFLKYVYYQLNNLFLYPEYVAIEHMNQFDEIWDCSQNNIKYYPEDVKDKIEYMPLRYVDVPKIEPRDEYKYDICFIGTLTPYREILISNITKYWTNDYCKIKILNGYPYSELSEEISDCKYIIDIPRRSDSAFILNHTRIFEALCSGKNVIINTYPEYDNIYTYLIKNYYNVYDILNVIKEEPIDYSETFRNWTESDFVYEEWRKYWMGNKYKQKINL